MAWLLYTQEHKGCFCSSNTQAAPPHDPNNWVGGFQKNGFHLGGLKDPQPDIFWSWIGAGVKDFAVEAGLLYPYLKDVNVYRCPDANWDYNVSYQINGVLAGEVGVPITLFKMSQIKHADSTFVFTESFDPNGWLTNSFKTPIYPAKLFSTNEVPGQNHVGRNAGDVISFADGHAIFWPYTDSRTGTIAMLAGRGGGGSDQWFTVDNNLTRDIDVYQLEAWSGGPVPISYQNWVSR